MQHVRRIVNAMDLVHCHMTYYIGCTCVSIGFPITVCGFGSFWCVCRELPGCVMPSLRVCNLILIGFEIILITFFSFSHTHTYTFIACNKKAQNQDFSTTGIVGAQEQSGSSTGTIEPVYTTVIPKVCKLCVQPAASIGNESTHTHTHTTVVTLTRASCILWCTSVWPDCFFPTTCIHLCFSASLREHLVPLKLDRIHHPRELLPFPLPNQ